MAPETAVLLRKMAERGQIESDLATIGGGRHTVYVDAEIVCKLDPRNAGAYAARARAKAALQDYPGAIADLDKEIELKPDSGEGYR